MDIGALKPIILDVDTGVDDAMGIMLAMNSPELDVRAITVCGGNNGLDQCCLNTVRVVNFAQQNLCPHVAIPLVARGLNPGGRAPEGAAVHGGDGLGGISDKLAFDMEQDMILGHARDVVHALYEQAEAVGEQLTIVTTGPLTNLAHWIQDMPGLLMRNTAGVISMGGAFFVNGNITAAAEFNIHSDPEAAAAVLRFCRGDDREDPPIPITFTGLDVTHKVTLRRGLLMQLLNAHPRNPMVPFLRDLTHTYMEFYEKFRGLDGCALHDPLAVALAADKSLCAMELFHVEIETKGQHTRGMTLADARNSAETRNCPRRSTRVCTAVNAERFEDFFIKRVTGIRGI